MSKQAYKSIIHYRKIEIDQMTSRLLTCIRRNLRNNIGEVLWKASESRIFRDSWISAQRETERKKEA